MSGERVLALLFTDKPHSHLVNRIKALNPTFAQGFKAGEMFCSIPRPACVKKPT